ncbi:MAG: DUF2894 domain-containing protein [Pseudomonadales bacterium]|jgi:hypothetical protein|nr:DUF2894 domain-containing protein [Pseudomonadales bacterium]MBP9033755.1 DUF2894 domain-containing protein [Pseudomonadales bacterium]
MTDPEPVGVSEAVRLHYLEALARRTQSAPDAVRQILQEKLQRAVADGANRSAQPSGARDDVLGEAAASHVPVTPLVALNRHIRAASGVAAPEQADHAPPGTSQARPELKSVQRFRESWSRIRAEDTLAQAVARGPEDAGPLNSHRLMLRTLTLMHALSPDYLRRYLSQAESLLWLEQARGKPGRPAGRSAPPRRGRAGHKSA